MSSQIIPTLTKKGRLRTVLEMIKVEHSVFALPFALVGALLAAREAGRFPTFWQIFWIIVAMVGARSAAMTINRIADIDYDRRNPRTAMRALPTGSFRLGSHGHSRFSARCSGDRRVAIESARAETFTGSARGVVFLFLHEAIYHLGALCSGILPGHVARGCVDCDSRVARLAHADPLRSRHAVGGRLRRAVRVPGY